MEAEIILDVFIETRRRRHWIGEEWRMGREIPSQWGGRSPPQLTRDYGKRRKLPPPQRDPGLSPDRKRLLPPIGVAERFS